MPWEYLDTEPFHLRYRIAASILNGKTKDKVIVDLNCGEPGLYHYLEKDFTAYYANDINPIETRGDKLHFKQIKDEDVDTRPQILALFGYGGGEFSGQVLESSKAGETIIRLSRYQPNYIVIEMAQMLEEKYQALTKIESRLAIYDPWVKTYMRIGNGAHFHDHRLLAVYQGVWLLNEEIT